MNQPAFFFRRAVSGAIVFIAAILLANTFVALGWLQPVVVSGSSMAPRYTDSQVFVRRWASTISRWEVAVMRSPADAQARIIKRVIGLPGEQLTIRDGDVWINDHRVVKSLAEQLCLRLPVELPTSEEGTSLMITSVYDSLPVNARVSRRLNRVEDLMIEAELYCDNEATWSVQIANRFVIEITGNGKARLLDSSGECLEQATLSISNPWRVIVSSFDSGAILVVGGAEIFSRLEVADRTDQGKESPAVEIISIGGKAEMRELSVWRDVYYEAMPVVGSPAIRPSEATWQLGPNAYFVVGDNQAISVDSRHWGVVPRRLSQGIVR